MRSPNWLACLGPLSLFATTLACNPDPTPNPNVTADGGAAALASINLVNLAYVTKLSGKDVVDVSMVDLYIDKQKATPALDYRKSSGNLKITPSVHTVELRAVGDDPSAPALLTATIDLLPGSRTLLAAIGRSADTDGPSRLQLVAAPLGTTDAASVKVRMFNATPEAPALDLAAGNNSVAGNAAYASASSYGSVALLPAATKLGLRLTRTTTDLAYVTLPAMATPGSVLTVLTLGELNPTADSKHFLGASVLDEGSGSVIDLPLVINDAGPKGSLYVIHASPDAPALDVVNAQGTKIITNVAYRQASALGELAAGQTAVDLRPTGTSATTLALQLKILPTLSWAVVAHGSIALGTSTKFEVTVMPRPAGPPDRVAAGACGLRRGGVRGGGVQAAPRARRLRAELVDPRYRAAGADLDPAARRRHAEAGLGYQRAADGAGCGAGTAGDRGGDRNGQQRHAAVRCARGAR